MIPRSFIAALLTPYVVLIVAFAVLMGAYAVAATAGDVGGASLLWRFAIGVAVLFATITILLIGALGLVHLESERKPTHGNETVGRDRDEE